jgi:hypothetical protein
MEDESERIDEEVDFDADLHGRRPIRKKESLRDILSSDPPWATQPSDAPPLPFSKDEQRQRKSSRSGRQEQMPSSPPSSNLAPPSISGKTSIGAHSTRSASNISTGSSDHLAGSAADLHTFPVPPARLHSPGPSPSVAPMLPKMESEPMDLGLPRSQTSPAATGSRRRLQPKDARERTAGSSKDLIDFLSNNGPPPSHAPGLPRSESTASVDSGTRFGKKTSSSRFRSFISRLGSQRDESNSGSVDLTRETASHPAATAAATHNRERSGSLSRKLSKRDRVPRSSSSQPSSSSAEQHQSHPSVTSSATTPSSLSSYQNGLPRHVNVNGFYANGKISEDHEDVRAAAVIPQPSSPSRRVVQEETTSLSQYEVEQLKSTTTTRSPRSSKSSTTRRVPQPLTNIEAAAAAEEALVPPSPASVYVDPVSPLQPPTISGSESYQSLVAEDATSVPAPPAQILSSAGDGEDEKEKEEKGLNDSGGGGREPSVDFVTALEALRAQMAKATSVEECLKLMDVAIAGATAGAGRQELHSSTQVEEGGGAGARQVGAEDALVVVREDDEVDLATVAAWFLEPSDLESVTPLSSGAPPVADAEDAEENNVGVDNAPSTQLAAAVVEPETEPSDKVASTAAAPTATGITTTPPTTASEDNHDAPKGSSSPATRKRSKRSRPTVAATVAASEALPHSSPQVVAAEAVLAP